MWSSGSACCWQCRHHFLLIYYIVVCFDKPPCCLDFKCGHIVSHRGVNQNKRLSLYRHLKMKGLHEMKHCTCGMQVSPGMCVCVEISKECTFWCFSKKPLSLALTCRALRPCSWTSEDCLRSHERRRGPKIITISPSLLLLASLFSSQLCVKSQSYHWHSSHSVLYLDSAGTRPYLCCL